ncbi:hypothetical protein Tco_0270210 [Tanacetum coccineum]
MAVLESCPKHNMVVYLEKTDGNAEFRNYDFSSRKAPFKMLSLYITAKVAGKPVSISEASIRSDLLFHDADGIDSLLNQAIFDAIQLMGYEGNLTGDKVWWCHERRKKEREKEVSTEDALGTDKQKVSTDKEKVSTDRPDEGTDRFKHVREKEKGVELKDAEETERLRPTSNRSLLTLKPLPKIDPKDKGKKKIKEEDESDTESEGIPEAEKKFKKLAHDEEIARKMQEDWETEEERKRLAKEEATNAALIQDFDDIKARMEADRLLALRLQEEKREKQRAIAIRNRPPTRTQLRDQMMTYLKHVGNKKHSDLKNKTFEEIQALYEKVKRFDESFIVVGSTKDERKVKEMNEGEKDLEHKSLKKRVVEEIPKKEDTAKYLPKGRCGQTGYKKRKWS